jgi:Trypsin
MKSVYGVIIAGICVASGAFAQTNPPSVFSVERPRLASGGIAAVIEGQPAQPKNWPATFVFRSGSTLCTSTMIGDRVMLTAGHCLPNGAKGQFTLQSGQKTIVTCTQHPEYDIDQRPPETKNLTKDFTLCVIDVALAGFPSERISTSINDVRADTTIRLLGFGCTERMGADQSFGVLYTGTTTIVRPPASNNDIHVITNGNAALCSGDSGDGAYTEPDANGRRILIGVNSRSNLSDSSWISSTATKTFMDWALGWSKDKNVQICGLHDTAAGCR